MTTKRSKLQQKNLEVNPFVVKTAEHISIHTDMKSTKRGIIRQETPKSIQYWSNHFWNPIAIFYVKEQHDKISTENLKKPRSNNGGNHAHQYNEVKEKM